MTCSFLETTNNFAPSSKTLLIFSTMHLPEPRTIFHQPLTLSTQYQYHPSMNDDSFHIGWIGLGRAGFPMAACLARKGHRLIVRDATCSQAIAFQTHYPRCRAAATEPDDFASCDVVFTMVRDGEMARDVLLGKKGIAWSLKAGNIGVCDLTCSDD
jgi:hypothetical protein